MGISTGVTRTSKGITFAVDDVELATVLVPERSVLASATDLIGDKLECVSDAEAMVVEAFTLHPLVAAVFIAFCDHRPLVLSPDDFWCAIVQGLSHHIAQDPEAFRKHFVAHEGKETIKIRRDDFVLGSPDNPWHEVIGDFSAQIKEHIGESMHQLIVADFSTTTPVARAVSEIALMDCTQNYFQYLLMSLCGIPQITLTGHSGDWERLKDKICFLNERFDLGWWLDRVSPIADQFIRAAKGEPDRDFWSSIFKYDGMSGGPYLSGWLMDFFPYLKDPMTNEVKRKNPFYSPGDTQGGITTAVIPGSCCRAPFDWEYMGKSMPYEFVGGFIGVEQNHESMALTPKLGWAVRPRVRTGLGRFDRSERAGIYCQVVNTFIPIPDLLTRYQINLAELAQVKEEFAVAETDRAKVDDFNYQVYQWFFLTDELRDEDSFSGGVRVACMDGRSRATGFAGDYDAWDELEELLVSAGGKHSHIEALKETRFTMDDGMFIQSLVNICSTMMLEYSIVTSAMRLAMKIMGGNECVVLFDEWLKSFSHSA